MRASPPVDPVMHRMAGGRWHAPLVSPGGAPTVVRKTPEGPDVPIAKLWRSPLLVSKDIGGDTKNPGARLRSGDDNAAGGGRGYYVGQSFSLSRPHYVEEVPLAAKGDKSKGGEQYEGADNLFAMLDKMIPTRPQVDNSPMTTLLVRNICRQLRQEDALAFWQWNIYKYDLFFVAHDGRNKRGLGRLFINFATHEDALAFREEWHGQYCQGISSVDHVDNLKPLDVSFALLQGVKPNIDYWQRSLPLHEVEAVLPAVFIDGERQEFRWFLHTLMSDAGL